MRKEIVKLLDLLFAAGIQTESEVLKLGFGDIRRLGIKNIQQIVLLEQLQQAIRERRLLELLADNSPKTASEYPQNGEAEAGKGAVWDGT